MLKAFILSIVVLACLYFAVRLVWFYESERLFCATSDSNYFAALGATSALFTGLAVVASAFAVGLQAIALRKSKNEVDTQLKTLMRQSFESSFFNILGMHRGYDESCCGIWFVKKFIRSIQENEGRIVEFYNGGAGDVESHDAGKFIKLCYIILRYVADASFLDEQERQFYVDIFKSMISDDECTLLAMHFVGKNGDPVIKELAENFALFSLHRLQVVPDEVKKMYSARIFRGTS